ncbi:MAG: DNA repair and recombination protein RadA [Candidatus Hodarchaeales archaeon]
MLLDEHTKEFIALKGVSDELAKKLASSYSSLSMVAIIAPQELAKELNISLKMAKHIVTTARGKIGINPITAVELLEKQLDRRNLTTGSQKLDEILGGGVQTGSITEFSGAFSSGKTQIAFQLSINAQMSEDFGGLNGSVYFIDTESTFSPKRVFEIAKNVENSKKITDAKTALTKIYISKAFNAQHQVELVKKADRMIGEKNIKLLIIDSIASHFRAEFLGKDMLSKRQQVLMAHAEMLQKYADSYGIAIVVTNQVIGNFDTFFDGSAVEPALGLAWAHRPAHRILLRKSKGTARIARIFDSPELPEREALFYINERGITDGY